mmetsp:Transcript_19650/g.61021  ORF Transcript_19650/g.61021 Transcript_19650/m.61021 type:complete len:239 (+) Transcript_19650:417-1133(+)
MTWSAPSDLTKSIFLVVPSGIRFSEAVAATVARAFFASCTAKAPVALDPPSISSFCPALRSPSRSPANELPSPVKSAWYVVSPASGSPAAASAAIPPRLAQRPAGRTANSAKAPPQPAAGGGLQHVSTRPRSATTASPAAKSLTSSPTASTTPEMSKPGVYGKEQGQTPSSPPLISFQSIGLTAAYCTLTRTCPAAGAGTGSVSHESDLIAAPTSPPSPYLARRHAFIVAAIAACGGS